MFDQLTVLILEPKTYITIRVTTDPREGWLVHTIIKVHVNKVIRMTTVGD